MKKRVVKLFLVFAVMFGLSMIFKTPTASAVATPDVFADSIYVGGVELQSGDFLESGSTTAVDSILEIDKSKGFAYYDGNELLLSNYTYEGMGIIHNTSERSVIWGMSTGSDTLAINVYGINTLTNTYSGSLFSANGIFIDGNLEIAGNGVLNINSSYGLCTGNNLVFNYAKTNINGSVYAILANGSITVNDGTVNATTANPVTAGSDITINGGSITVSSSNAAFNVCPSYTEEVYNKSILTVSENKDGSEPSASFDKANFNKYKYFSFQELSREKKNNIYVSNFNVPSVSKTVSQIEVQTTLDYGLDAEAYACESIIVEKKVDDNWVTLDSDYVLRYNENYRVVLDILPKDGYTINSNIDSVTGYINESMVEVFEITEYAEYYGAKIGYEFIFETTDTEVTSFSTTLELPKIGQVYGDIEYSSDDITCSEGFSYSSFQIYEGTTVLEETQALEKDVDYTLVLGFELADGYYAFDIEEVTINGNVPTLSQFDGNVLILSYKFKLTTTSIDAVEITNFETPNVGQKFSDIDINDFVYGEGYEFIGITYFNEDTICDENTVIKYDTEYRYSFLFIDKEGYELSAATTATINGEAATSNYDESNDIIQVIYILKHESTPIDAVYINGVIFPEVGDKVVDVDLSGVSYANSKYELCDIVCWFSYSDDEVTDDTILQYDIEYAYTFVFVAKEGYKFSDENALVNGDYVSSWYGTHEGGETVYFEAYYYHIIESDNKKITEIEIYNYDIPNVGQKFSDVENTNDTVVFGGEYKIVDQNFGIYDIDLDETVEYNGEIQRGPEYSIYLLLEANEGYKFSFEMDDTAIFNSERAYCHEIVKDGKRYMQIFYWFNYPEVSEEIEINSIEISNVDIPKVGETLLDIINTPDTVLWGEEYEIENLILFGVVDGNLVSPIPMDYEIDYNEEYAFVFNIEAKEGYIFSLIEKATVNNDYAVILGMDSDGVLAIGYFFSYKTYDIYIADKDEEGNTISVQVSDMNKDDVLGDGTVSYDPKTNTLTLNNYTYEGEGFDVDGGYVAIQLDLYENDVTIILKGENVINVTGENTAGILAFGDYNLNIEGDGSLEINSTMHGIGFQGEFGTISINGPKIVIYSEGSIMTTGIWAPNFVMKAGSLKINSITLGIIVISESSKIDINGGSIEISVSVAGNTIAYMDGTMTFAPTLANLEEYALTYEAIAGTKSDGSNAAEFDEELIEAYRYFKISHVCNLELIEQVNPTCTDTGKNAYYTCDSCGKHYEDINGTVEITDLASWGIISALGHDYAEATCTAPKTCKRDNCNATEGAALGHDYADATCTTPKTCKVCSATEGAALGHDYAEATCTTPKTCKVCSATEGTALGHSFNDTWLNDNAKHWKECACTEKGYAAAHVDANSDNKCDVCSYDMTVPHTHEFSDSWKNDENNHWKECACTEKKDVAAHVDANSDGKCDTCGYEMQTQSSTPTEPTNPTEPKPEKKGLSGGAVAAIVVSSVAVGGISGFAIFWFAIKKKKFADLVAVFIKKK